jgi:hypothetical protein
MTRWHPSRRTRHSRWAALAPIVALTTAASGLGIALSGTSAQAAQTLAEATQIMSLHASIVAVVPGSTNRAPSLKNAGGPGSAAANAAVRSGCGTGSAYADPQWYALPAWNGKVSLGGGHQEPYEVAPRQARFALLDADTLAVLSCSPKVFTLEASKPRLLVAYFPAHQECTEEWAEPNGCYPGAGYTYGLAQAATPAVAPPNDHWQDAVPITSLPYEATADLREADVDRVSIDGYGGYVPPCIAYDSYHRADAWWSYTPSVSGPVRFQALSTMQSEAYVYVSPRRADGSPTPDLGGINDPDHSLVSCEGGMSQSLTAGTTYLIAAYFEDDTFRDGQTDQEGGWPLRLRVGGAPMAGSTGVWATPDPATKSANIWWLGDGMTPPDGYRVSRDGTDDGGAGPWSTVVAYPSTSDFTFTHLRPWVTYTMSAEPVFSGGGVDTFGSSTRVFLSAPTPSVPRSVKATPGTNKATVTWRPPAFVGKSQVTGYKVRKYLVTSSGSVLQQTLSLPASARTYMFSGLSAGKSYRFNATALNAQGAGVTSAKTTALTP